MEEALGEAQQSLARGDFPVGAVVVHKGEIVARAHWTTSPSLRLLDHAELLALTSAERSGRLASRRQRRESTLYTTLEPCALCMAAAMSFLLGEIVFGAEARVDGGTNLPDVWQPPNGHPLDDMPYGDPGGPRRRPPRREPRPVGRMDPQRRASLLGGGLFAVWNCHLGTLRT
jgi:tRNA(Arg) A34 adenosine deaminase TadA